MHSLDPCGPASLPRAWADWPALLLSSQPEPVQQPRHTPGPGPAFPIWPHFPKKEIAPCPQRSFQLRRRLGTGNCPPNSAHLLFNGQNVSAHPGSPPHGTFPLPPSQYLLKFLTCQDRGMPMTNPNRKRRARPKYVMTIHEGRTMHRVVTRIHHALGPFTPREMLLFHPKKGFSTLDEFPDKHGRREWKPVGKPGFFERLFTELPRNVQRRFLLLNSKGKATLTRRQRRKLEREILGHARRKLMRELTARIQKLPHLVGSGPGGADPEECQQIRKRVKELLKKPKKGEKPMSRWAACKYEREHGCKLSARQIYRITFGH
jgi:hypothetical protein